MECKSEMCEENVRKLLELHGKVSGMYKKNKRLKWENIGARMKLNGVNWSVAACLLADDTVLVTESERELQRVVDQFHSVCSRRNLKVNAGKSNVMVFERKEVEVVNFGNPYSECTS